jgi:hypothetical protein
MGSFETTGRVIEGQDQSASDTWDPSIEAGRLLRSGVEQGGY